MDFLKKYNITDEDIDSLIENYNDGLIELVSNNQILVEQNINVFLSYGFDYIEDIIMYNLPLFVMGTTYIREKLNNLKLKLGDNYIELIGDNLDLLD